MSVLPQGWVNAKLSDVATWGSGGTPSRRNAAYFGGTIPWVKTGELGQRYVTETQEYLTELGIENSNAKIFPQGSVAIAMYGATIGKTSILDIDAATNQACAVGKPDTEVVCREFLYHFLCSQKSSFIDAGKGGAQPNISQGVIKDWSIPLAPLTEQARIADKLDALLARVDAARERLDRIPHILKRFRQSVLAAATSGDLTEDWREGGAVEWASVSVRDVGHARLGKMLDKSKNTGKETLYLRNINVRWFGFDLSDVGEIRVSDEERVELSIADGDVLICEGGEPGRCATWRNGENDFVFQKALHRVRLGDTCLPEWLCYCLKVDADSNALSEFFTGTTIKHLTGTALDRWQFPLPPKAEQSEIIRRVESLFAFADAVQAQYTAARARVDKLTPALLAKAFRGELVPQDPNDEPAEKLLARLREANQGAAGPVKRGRKPTTA